MEQKVFSRNDINENALYVLKVDDNGLFYTDYVEIDKALENEIGLEDLFHIVFDKPENSNIEGNYLITIRKRAIYDFFDKIKARYKFLLAERNYCSKLSLNSAYSTEYLKEPLEIKYDNGEYRISVIASGFGEVSTWVKKYIKDNIVNSYLIEQAYEICRKQPKIKAYSHRRCGWTKYNFKLNDIFSVLIETNFGYGYSSYFCTTLVYDNIKIIPYSRLVLYRFANTMQLKRHTCDYSIMDDSWKLAFDFVKDACNDFMENGRESFVVKYMINECETLCDLLPKYLRVNIFKLSDKKDGTFQYGDETKWEEVELNGYELFVFRGEKVSGAVNFIESIKQMNSLFPTQNYIDCIYDCCINVLPMISNTILEIDNELPLLQSELNDLEKNNTDLRDKLEVVNKQVRELDSYKSTLRAKIFEEHKSREGVQTLYSPFVCSLTEEHFNNEHPEYENLVHQKNDLNRELAIQLDLKSLKQRKFRDLPEKRTQLLEYETNIRSYIGN